MMATASEQTRKYTSWCSSGSMPEQLSTGAINRGVLQMNLNLFGEGPTNQSACAHQMDGVLGKICMTPLCAACVQLKEMKGLARQPRSNLPASTHEEACPTACPRERPPWQHLKHSRLADACMCRPTASSTSRPAQSAVAGQCPGELGTNGAIQADTCMCRPQAWAATRPGQSAIAGQYLCELVTDGCAGWEGTSVVLWVAPQLQHTGLKHAADIGVPSVQVYNVVGN